MVAPPLAIRETKLENGLTIVVHEDHRAPLVTVNLWYDVGGKDDPPQKSGLAHLFEHLMLQGSKHVPEDAYYRLLEQAGATDRNATTNLDRTNYFETVPSNELSLALWLESDRMGFLLDHLDSRTFENQRAVVKNERRQRYENEPYGYWWIFMNEAVHPSGHPYHRATIGDGQEIDGVTLDEARAFFRTWYAPNNATLVIAGDVKADAAIAEATKWFAAIPAHRVPERPRPAAVKLSGETFVYVEAGVKVPRAYVAWPSPGAFAQGDAELALASLILGEGASSRLRRKLVDELQIAERVDVVDDASRYDGIFYVRATARPGHSAAELVAAIDAELAVLRDAGVTDAEVARARTAASSHLVFQLERGGARADALNEYRFMLGTPNGLARHLEGYSSATPASIREAVRAWLPADRRAVVLFTPRADAPIAGERVRTITTEAK